MCKGAVAEGSRMISQEVKGSLCVGRAEREEEMAQGDVVVAVTGQAGQDLADLVGDLICI